MSLSEEISRLAEEYDPAKEADANATRSFLQGMLWAEVAKQRPGNPGRILKVTDIHQGMDEHGNYLPYFTVLTEGGHRVKVSLEVE